MLADQWEAVQEQGFLTRAFNWEENLNYCLVGIRRAGKSYLLIQRIHELLKEGVPEDHILYVNFEDERLLEMTAADLHLRLEAQAEFAEDHKVTHVFLDELQNVTGGVEVCPAAGSQQVPCVRDREQCEDAEPGDRDDAGRAFHDAGGVSV